MGKSTEVFNIGQKAAIVVGNLYFLMLMCVFTLLEHKGYSDILTVKATFFLVISTGAIVFFAGYKITVFIMQRSSSGSWKHQSIDATDFFVLAFLCVLTVSLFVSPDVHAAFWGLEGRRTGYFVLALCCAVFWVGKYAVRIHKVAFAAAAVAAAFISIIGFCNHLGYNPFGLCSTAGDINSQFISTLGNRNCLAAYLALWLALSIPYFCMKKRGWWMWLDAAFLMVLFLGVFSAMSDSAFLVTAVLFFVIFVVSIGNPSALFRLGVLLLIFTASLYIFLAACDMCSETSWVMSGLGKLALLAPGRWFLTAGSVLFFVVAACLYKRKRSHGKPCLKEETAKKTARTILAAVLVFVLFAVMLITWVTAAKTPHEAKEFFGQLYPYLYFGKAWGTNRGIIWRSAVSTYAGMPFLHKLFGYGPASFKAAYEAFDATNVTAKIQGVLVDAHNEFLQYLVTTGIIGVVCYFGIFFSALVQFIKEIRTKRPKAVYGICLVSAFLVQGFVNNTHLYIEPIAFLFLGLLSGRALSGVKYPVKEASPKSGGSKRRG